MRSGTAALWKFLLLHRFDPHGGVHHDRARLVARARRIARPP
jgi:hypothetical protein